MFFEDKTNSDNMLRGGIARENISPYFKENPKYSFYVTVVTLKDSCQKLYFHECEYYIKNGLVYIMQYGEWRAEDKKERPTRYDNYFPYYSSQVIRVLTQNCFSEVELILMDYEEWLEKFGED